jgi:mRNA-degrading endonuclease RelE of RelBE toxin-antitoxin system
VPKYRLVLHRKAEKALAGLDAKTERMVLEDIRCLADFSGFKSRLDVVKMAGMKDFYRLRSGRIRIMFTLDKPSETIIILKVEQRERVYE